MICSRCNKREANVHFSAVVNGKEVSAHMCEACAHSSAQFPDASPIFSELIGLLSRWTAKPARPAAARACPRCHWTPAQFQKTGRMGCPDCYGCFQNELRPLLKKVHGASAHRGKKARIPAPQVPAPQPKAREKKASTADLKTQLEKAVQQENFELAAQLRDKIRSLEREGR